MLNSPHIIRSVITDKPEMLSPFYDVLLPYKPEFVDPFALKTQLFQYTPFDKTLYVDADSLVMNSIDTYWNALEDRAFAYTGDMIDRGEWYLNIEELIKQISVPWIPKFNSGMFLFDTGEKAKSVFDTAFRYMQNNHGMDVPFFRGTMLPDEPFFAMALAKHNEKPLEDHGRFSRTLIGADHIRINAVKGFAGFIKNGRPVFPLVVHFCGRFGQIFYTREKLRLFFCFNPPIAVFFAALFSLIRNIRKKTFGKTKTAL
jgi:hypothetical protein